jgi:hypothetical protein
MVRLLVEALGFNLGDLWKLFHFRRFSARTHRRSSCAVN